MRARDKQNMFFDKIKEQLIPYGFLHKMVVYGNISKIVNSLSIFQFHWIDLVG